MNRLFVYGTLKTDGILFRQIESFVSSVSNLASIRGCLISCGDYPALISGNGIVTGQLLYISDEGIEICHEIEGYDPQDKRNSLYWYGATEVTLAGERNIIPAMTYFWNGIVHFEWLNATKNVSTKGEGNVG